LELGDGGGEGSGVRDGAGVGGEMLVLMTFMDVDMVMEVRG
jgi:hypothetical protein